MIRTDYVHLTNTPEQKQAQEYVGSVPHVNIQSFVRFFARLFTPDRSHDGLANGPKLLT